MNQRDYNYLTDMTSRISKITDNMQSQEVKSQFDTKTKTKLQYRQKLLDKLVTDCITYRLTEKEAHRYIEEEYGKPIASKTYFTIKSRLESQSEVTSQLWLNEFTRIGFVQHHRKLIDNLERIYEDNLNRFFIESRKEPRNDELILKINANIRENTRLLCELGLGSPIIAGIKSKLQQYEIKSVFANTTPESESEQQQKQQQLQLQEGLSNQPWDNHDWSQCNKCKKWFGIEFIQKDSCYCRSCALPETVF